jgi:regulator of protease activity HflC (stomatin/prohibitin superfamily)
MNAQQIKVLGVIVLVILAVVVYDAAFIVDETEQVVITQFGRITGEPVVEPGLNFKVPFIQKTNFFAKNLLGMGRQSRPDSHQGQNLYLGGHICQVADYRSPHLF